MNEVLLTTIVSTLGGVSIAYFAYKGKQALTARNIKNAPKDRMETIFDGYEAFIARQDKALDYKDKQLKENQEIINRMQMQIDDLQALIEKQREETERERTINSQLHSELDKMRKRYSNNKDGK